MSQNKTIPTIFSMQLFDEHDMEYLSFKKDLINDSDLYQKIHF